MRVRWVFGAEGHAEIGPCSSGDREAGHEKAVSVLPQARQTPAAAGIISLVEGVRVCVCVLRLEVGGWRDSFVTTCGGITVKIWLCMDSYCLGSLVGASIPEEGCVSGSVQMSGQEKSYFHFVESLNCTGSGKV